MQTRIFHTLLTSLLLLVCFLVTLRAQTPAFPPDPGQVYVPPTVTIMGQEIVVSDTTDTTAVIPKEIDVFGDSTVMYDTEENVLTITSATMEVGDTMQAAISYTGSETLVIVLCDSSTIFADTIISSTSDIVITGDGVLVAEGIVPIIGTPKASITFDSVSMYVRSLRGPEAVRRRIRRGKMLDENGGPALSGFATADFNKTAITPPDAEYGEVEMEESSFPGGTPGSSTINALYVVTESGEAEVLTEFVLTAIADAIEAVESTYSRHELDPSRPMYNMLGIQVSATYKGVVIQDGQTFILQ